MNPGFIRSSILCLLMTVFLCPNTSESQCSIPWLDNCIDQVNVCGLTDINGIPCTIIPFANTSNCNQVCGKPADNIMWLCFCSAGVFCKLFFFLLFYSFVFPHLINQITPKKKKKKKKKKK